MILWYSRVDSNQETYKRHIESTNMNIISIWTQTQTLIFISKSFTLEFKIRGKVRLIDSISTTCLPLKVSSSKVRSPWYTLNIWLKLDVKAGTEMASILTTFRTIWVNWELNQHSTLYHLNLCSHVIMIQSILQIFIHIHTRTCASILMNWLLTASIVIV